MLFNYLVVFVVISGYTCLPDEPEITFERLYQYAKNEYTNENWHQCIAFSLRAIEDFNYFLDETVWCRKKCDQQISYKQEFRKEDISDEIYEIAQSYTTAQKALCILRCKRDRFTDRRPPLTDYNTFDSFQNRKPFDYLQYCYWKIGELEMAVRSAYTYLVADPTNQEALNNLVFYMEHGGFRSEMLTDTLKMKYEEYYMKGVEAYNYEKWQDCTFQLEQSLEEFFIEEQNCRHLCEDKLNWELFEGNNPEYTVIFTSIFASVIRCKNECKKKLSKVNGHFLDDILKSYFDYLHVCYYKLNRGRDACQAVANSLLLDDYNPIMRRNRIFYSKFYGRDELFQPSEQILKFHNRRKAEETFIEFIDERFRYVDNELPNERADDRISMKVNLPYEDNFDYTLIENELLVEKECAQIAIAEIFPKLDSHYRQLIFELEQRIADRYKTNANFVEVKCGNKIVGEKCKRYTFIISLEKSQCGAFLSENNRTKGCAIIFCLANQ